MAEREYTRKPPMERFLAHVDKNGPVPMKRPDLGPCWIWTASRNKDGYGKFSVSRRVWRHAHVVAYEFYRGVKPPGCDLHHWCENPPCCNPWHVDAVTKQAHCHIGNSAGGRNARKTHCPQGHPYSPENTYIDKKNRRYCRQCHHDRQCRRVLDFP